ncbi:MAG: phosphoenolpyruvate synthase [Candidatus ainarchaeum sp.]|nr:phosphoenolpyruvate synthase [Candidatus ainarchaeum sp.]
MVGKNILWFSEIGKDDIGQAGGKGANLGEMAGAGFPVPPGFLVTAQAYFSFLAANDIEPLIRDATNRLDVEDSGALERASAAIKDAIADGRVPDEIRVEIVRAYNTLCGFSAMSVPTVEASKFVAVRSSATAEDLPDASFAGQQATFLNVRGQDALVDAVRDCWASLFEPRAIYYRVNKGFDHLKVGIAVVVQEMIQSESAGVMFTIDPTNNDPDMIAIEAAFGLGELVVSGSVTPDHYLVRKKDFAIVSKRIVSQEVMITMVGGGNEKVPVPFEVRDQQKISDKQVAELAILGKMIEDHYGSPQDIEWAVFQGTVYIVQSRAVTTYKPGAQEPAGGEPGERARAKAGGAKPAGPAPRPKEKREKAAAVQAGAEPPQEDAGEGAGGAQMGEAVDVKDAEIIVRGSGASPGVAFGKVRIIESPKEIGKMKQGDILVTEMTTPDFVPAMKKAVAIVTDAGGTTCHAAIVSRELGIPCIVGTQNATKVLKDGDSITVDAVHGIVYRGEVKLEPPKKREANGGAGGYPPVCGTKIYVNIAEPELAERAAALPVDGVGLLRAEFIIAGIGEHPRKMMEEGRGQEFTDKLAEGMRKIAAAFYPRPVVYRATDFKTNEYRNLAGGEKYEPVEANPMMGYRGCSRYILEEDLFKLELDAIKKVRNTYGLRNLWLMIPFVRKIGEIRAIKEILKRNDIHFTKDFKLWIMVEVPSTVFMIDEFCKEGIHGISIGSNDLTQLILGIDRDNATMSDAFDERNLAVMRAIREVITKCNKYGVTTSICGQAPSVYPEFAQALVDIGINSISVNPDAAETARMNVASAEQKLMLKRLLEISQALPDSKSEAD